MEIIGYRSRQGSWLILGLLALAGCGSGAGKSAPRDTSLKEFASFYDQYLKEHQNQPPADEQSFRDYLQSKQDKLSAVGLTVDEMFQSPLNGAALTWIYGKRPPKGGYGEIFVAYEKAPVDGRWPVITAQGTVVKMDDAWFHSVFR